MLAAVREERLRLGDAQARLQSLGATYVGPSRHGGEVYWIGGYELYALVRRSLGTAWIGYFRDRASCGC